MKNIEHLVVIITFILLPLFVLSQESVSFKIVAGDNDRLDCPVFIDLSHKTTFNNKNSISLYEITKSGLKSVNFQFDNEGQNGIWFIAEGWFPKNTERHFILNNVDDKKVKSVFPMIVKQTEDVLILKNGKQNILSYQTKTVMPPKGVDTAFQRSGFVHPLWSPDGEVLTRIQPPDHYHHYGIWAPWTKTQINGRDVDLWNLGKKQGTVRFAGLTKITEGPVFCEIKVRQEYIDFGNQGKSQVAINENLTLIAWDVGKNAWLIDYITEQSSPLDSGILLDAYRYGGGIGYRATEKWKKDNCSVLTSEGKTRDSADGTKARWCRIEGTSKKGQSGILFMNFPENRDFHEPMRVWPSNSIDDNGYLFFEFCPIRHNSWKMEHSQNYKLRYRLYVFDGNMSKEEAEAIWQAFAYPPEVVFEN